MRSSKLVFCILLFVVLIVPFLVNNLLILHNPFRSIPNAVGSQTDWLIFWGNYSGSVITGLITMYVLFKTVRSQTLNIKYSQQQNWLNSLIEALKDNSRYLDFANINKLRSFQSEPELFFLKLEELMQTLPHKTDEFGYLFPNANLSKEEEDYYEAYQTLHDFFLQIIIKLWRAEIIKRSKDSNSFRCTIESWKNKGKNEDSIFDREIYEKLENLTDLEEVRKIMDEFIERIYVKEFNLWSERYLTMQECAKKLVKYEKQKIENMLDQ